MGSIVTPRVIVRVTLASQSQSSDLLSCLLLHFGQYGPSREGANGRSAASSGSPSLPARGISDSHGSANGPDYSTGYGTFWITCIAPLALLPCQRPTQPRRFRPCHMPGLSHGSIPGGLHGFLPDWESQSMGHGRVCNSPLCGSVTDFQAALQRENTPYVTTPSASAISRQRVAGTPQRSATSIQELLVPVDLPPDSDSSPSPSPSGRIIGCRRLRRAAVTGQERRRDPRSPKHQVCQLLSVPRQFSADTFPWDQRRSPRNWEERGPRRKKDGADSWKVGAFTAGTKITLWPPVQPKGPKQPGTPNVKPDALSCLYDPEPLAKEPETILPPNCVVGAVTWQIEKDVKQANGFRRTMYAISRRFWWPSIEQEVPESSTRSRMSLLQPPSHSISLDFVTGLPISRGKTTVFTVVDRFSKMVRFIALPKLPSAKETAEVMINQVF
ncbi:uncharacterized protein LOC144054831 [Vanacampus margaritifer]